MLSLDNTNFSSTISKGSTVVDFWAPWCGPCRMMEPIFEELSKSKSYETVKFAKLNTDEYGEIAQNLGIRGIPTLIFFKDGKEINRYVGASSKQQLEARIKDNFG